MSAEHSLEIRRDPECRWTAVYVKPRCEKVVWQYCQRRQLPCYLPLRRRAQRYQRRTVVTMLPMFPGYVFAQLSDERMTVLVRCNRIVTALRVNEIQEEKLVRELLELQQLEALQEVADLTVQPELTPGTTVLVKEGPLQGLTGIVERRKGRTRVTVNVELLGQSVSAELDAGELRAEKP